MRRASGCRRSLYTLLASSGGCQRWWIAREVVVVTSANVAIWLAKRRLPSLEAQTIPTRDPGRIRDLAQGSLVRVRVDADDTESRPPDPEITHFFDVKET